MTRFAVAAAFALTLLSTADSHGGIADSPLPVLDPARTTLHLYSVPGLVMSGFIEAYFSCTSTDTAPMKVSVEIFGYNSGLLNDAAADSLTVAPGTTVIFGTAAPSWVGIDKGIGTGGVPRGSARILATSKKLACTAFLADKVNAPPTSMVQLTIIAKTKQKAAN
jgi:hypothetical protein